jgi:hypothetical protein
MLASLFKQLGFLEIISDYMLVFILGHICCSALNYNFLETSITNFLKQKKIIRLFQEQNTIFDELSNGLILYREDESQDAI